MGTIFNKGFHHKYIRPCPLIFQASQHLTLDMVGPRDETGHGWSSLGRMLSILTSIQWCLPFVLPHIFQLIPSWRGKTKQKLPKFQQLIVSLSLASNIFVSSFQIVLTGLARGWCHLKHCAMSLSRSTGHSIASVSMGTFFSQNRIFHFNCEK